MRAKRYRVSATLAAVMALASFSVGTSPAAGVAGFGDVAETRFYTKAVQWMVDNDITTGTSATCFSPDDPVTRGQASAFMWRMEGEPAAPPHPFVDVTKGWQQGSVSWMAANSITTGTSASTFSPEHVLTRGQLAALLWRLDGEPDAPPHSFIDVTKWWQQGPVSWMVETGITTGTSTFTFSPEAAVTRGQIATFFYRYKGEPPVIIDPTHPTLPTCAQQVGGPTATTTTVGVPPNPGNSKNCSDFSTQAEAQAWFDTYFPFYGDVANLDAGGNGIPCENLP